MFGAWYFPPNPAVLYAYCNDVFLKSPPKDIFSVVLQSEWKGERERNVDAPAGCLSQEPAAEGGARPGPS